AALSRLLALEDHDAEERDQQRDDEEEAPRGREALREAVEDRVRLADPALPAAPLGLDRLAVLGDQLVLRLLPLDGVELRDILAVEGVPRLFGETRPFVLARPHARLCTRPGP